MHVKLETKVIESFSAVAGQRRAAADAPRVFLAGRLTGMTAPGSEESQMLGLARSLPDAGIAARLWRPWEDALTGVDCLHLFGSLAEHVPVLEAARRQRLPVALSPMVSYDLADCLRQGQPGTRGLAACTRLVSRAVFPYWPSWRRQLYRGVDLLLPHSNAEAQQLMYYFRVPPERIRIVPRGADPALATADPEPFAQLVGQRGFALCCGSIEPRNNQLGILWAMRDADLPLVVLGRVPDGFEWYLEQCRRAAGPQVQFVHQVRAGDTRLASAYAACGCLVLGGRFDGAVSMALEAGMSGTPLVLCAGSCAREYFGRQAHYVNPNDLPGIRRAVLAAASQARSKSLARHVQIYFSWTAAAKAMREAYQSVLSRELS